MGSGGAQRQAPSQFGLEGQQNRARRVSIAGGGTMRFAIPVLLVLLTGAAAAGDDPKPAPSGSYAMETRHSQVLFAIPHLGITDYHGRFDRLSGSLNFDSATPAKSTVTANIDMTSVDTPSHELMNELMGAGVFNTATFPTATFKSTSVVVTGANSGTITGDLTLHGVTKSVTLNAIFGGTTTDPFSGADDIGFHATTTVNRKDFGIAGMVWDHIVGDEVEITIEAMFQRPKGK
jgi:polyisoprenoid-binding protein YceI